MEIGAVIVAAGMSSRMGDFKPMLQLGNITVAQRVIATLQQAGIKKIVVVTGCNAEVLEKHLAKNCVIFLRNENYQHTQMFDSACIGFRYLKDKCQKILFTPVDIPLFTVETIQMLMQQSEDFVCPVYKQKKGHPILLSAKAVEKILNDDGKNGLKGAIQKSGLEEKRVPVKDCGILHDADTPQDYRELLNLHNSQLMRADVQIAIAQQSAFLDARCAMLLELIKETESVRQACRQMNLSYSCGWNIIRCLEENIGKQVVERMPGGKYGGKSFLTSTGSRLVECYEIYTQKVTQMANELFKDYFGDLLMKKGEKE